MQVVVSGIGAVCHAGTTVDEVWDGMVAARAASRPVRDKYMDAPIRNIYLVAGSADEEDDVCPGESRSRAGRFAARAAHEALRDAGPGPDPARVGLVVGSCMGTSGAIERFRVGYLAQQPPELFSLTSDLAAALSVEGPVLNIANACAASAYAVGQAVDLLEAGDCDRVVVVGVEAYSRVALACFNAMAALDPERCRPFATERAGTQFGEGAAALVLDRVAAADTDPGGDAHSLAVGNGAALPEGRILLAGSGFSCDAAHATAPDAEGTQARRALLVALDQADVVPADVGLVVPHGTGTALNDVVESAMIGELWPAAENAPTVYSAKALLGHTGGGAGALAAVLAVLCLRKGEVPGNCDVGNLMPEIADYLPAHPTPSGDVAVVNAYAFGGNNASLVFRRAS